MDCGGAEKLLGRGDMLFHANGANKPVRAQAAFVSDEEVESIMDFFTRQQTDESKPRYQEITLEEGFFHGRRRYRSGQRQAGG